MNNNNKMEAILTILLPEVIKEIMKNENITEDEATISFYESSLYSTLEDEESDLWHLSPKMLYELYRQEKHIGTIYYPREQ